MKPMIIFGPAGSGASTYASKLVAEQGRKIFTNHMGTPMMEVKSGVWALEFLLQARSGDVTTIQATSLEEAQQWFKTFVHEEGIARFEFVQVPAWASAAAVKDIATTVQREAAEAMKGLLDKLSKLPSWPQGPITIPLPSGQVVEVKSQEGKFEAFTIYVQPAT